MGVIRKIFNDKFPLHSRRLTAFSLKQPEGQDFLEFYASAEKVFAAADIKSMSGEDVMSSLLIMACCDQDLKKEFFKTEQPTVSKLLACARTYQAVKANQAA